MFRFSPKRLYLHISSGLSICYLVDIAPLCIKLNLQGKSRQWNKLMTILPQNYNYKSSLKSYSLSSHLQLLSYDQPPNTSPFLDAFKVGIPTFALAISYVCCTFWSLKNSYIHILFD